MKNKEKKISYAAQIYNREAQLLEKIERIQDDTNISKDALLKEYIDLGHEYAKLLKQTIKITRIGDSNQRKLFLANEQIEKQKEKLSIAYKKMEVLARIDPLTQLSNRRDFLEKFQHEINRFERSRRPFSVVMGDLDDFKAVNDRYGHDCGDFVLVSIAKIIRSMVRKQDTVGRWGGEEFILLLPESPLEGGKIVAEGIRKRIAAETFSFKSQLFSITITLGVTEFSETMDIDDCIKQADESMYSGKRKGKNQVVSVET
ncbi:MAG: GGDEF domain-containing protein [Candidatus Aminicenantes bacterium]|nr:MAG: GGDEF domain-containing protein [Candidatus Aminicenantes bacterium]